MPQSPQHSYPSLNDSLYAERLATPTFPRGLPSPPPLTSSFATKGRHSARQLDDGRSSDGHHHAPSPSSSRASPSLGGVEGLGASLNHSFSHPPLGVALDEEQRRCVNTAFHISFNGNPRVKHKPTSVELPNGASFLIVDRFVSGNSDGVYEKNRKMWEQIPLGQARVFARTPVREEAAEEDEARRRGEEGPRSPAVAPAAYPTPLPSSGEWTYVATAVGLRKMGHWREATTVYALHKETAKSAIALEKVDGESGQLSAFTWLGVRYWVVGCRYQHIVTRLEVPEADLVRYAAATSSAASTASSSSDLTVEGGPSRHSPLASPTSEPPTAVGTGRQQRSRHGSSVTTLPSGAATSTEACYLDLAVRMARLWRHVLESLPITTTTTTTTPAAVAMDAVADGGVVGDGRAAKAQAWAALHARVESDGRSLCFDAILAGWERLQTFTAQVDREADDSDDAASTSTAGTATPASAPSSVSSFRTAQPTASAVFASPSLATTTRTTTNTNTWEAEVPLWFYAVTWDRPLEVRGWCMPVRRALAFFASAGLPPVPASEEVQVGSPAYEALRQSVLSRCDTAGAVLYGSNRDAGSAADSALEEDGDDDEEGEGGAGGGGRSATRGRETEAVVQVWKCRAYPHTLERVVQEYVVTHRLCGDPLRNKMKKKVSSLSRETRLYIKQWELHRLPFLMDFALWLHREKYITPSTDLAALKNIRGHWLSYQEKFKDVLLAQLQRQQQRLSARPSSVSTLDVSRKEERVDEANSAENARSDDETAEEDAVDAVMLVGPQGCGKSTMARILYALLEEAGAAPRWLNQDEVGTRSAYLAAIRRAMTSGAYSHLLLDKMNLDDKARADYGEMGVKPVLVVAWAHSSGTEAMVEACYQRVVQRGACHRTFFHADAPRSAAHPLSLSNTSSRSPELRPVASPVADAASPTSTGGGGSLAAGAAAWGSPAATAVASASAASPSSRLHGILEASARRYQAPSHQPCVELDVTWDCRRAVAVVWAALRDKGTCELPPLGDLDVEAAVQTAYAYERMLETYPTRVAAAVLRGPSSEAMLDLLGACRPPAIPKTQRRQPQVEALLHDFQLNPSPTALVRYAGQVGAVRRLSVQAVVMNSKVVLLLMLGPSERAAAAAAVTGTDSDDAWTVSQALDECVEVPARQEHWAVLAKAKKVTAEYCETLAQRVRDDPEEDPYCSVRWLSPPLVVDFAVSFAFP